MPPVRCQRCQRFKRGDGILLCPRCTAVGSFTQSVTIRPQTVIAVATFGGRTAERPVLPPITSTVDARVRVGRRKLRVVRRRGRFYRDRGRYEMETLTTDQLTKFERHSWYHPASGEEHVKSGPLGDPDMHGPVSASRFRQIVHPPSDSYD